MPFDPIVEKSKLLHSITKHSLSGTSLRYAYINFQDPEDASQALKLVNHTVVKGKRIRLMWCQRDPSLKKLGKGNVFVKNLDVSIDDETLHDTFAQV